LNEIVGCIAAERVVQAASAPHARFERTLAICHAAFSLSGTKLWIENEARKSRMTLINLKRGGPTCNMPLRKDLLDARAGFLQAVSSNDDSASISPHQQQHSAPGIAFSISREFSKLPI
jgi:hypothetical protein